MNIVLFGPPGAGKGTQAAYIRDKFSLCHISTGNLLRNEVAEGTPLGQRVSAIIDAGQLVSDDLMFEILEKRIKQQDCENGFILDGFPRTEVQAKGLDALLSKHGLTIDIAIIIVVEEEALVTRITGRFTCANCGAGYHDVFAPTAVAGVCDACGSTQFSRREDDKAETLKSRLAIYHEQTAPVLPHYKQKGILRSVDGMQSIDQVSTQIDSLVNELKQLT